MVVEERRQVHRGEEGKQKSSSATPEVRHTRSKNMVKLHVNFTCELHIVKQLQAACEAACSPGVREDFKLQLLEKPLS